MEKTSVTVESKKEIARQNVERALDVALIVIQNGGSTNLANNAFLNILKGFNQTGVSLSWRLDHITARVETEGTSITLMRTVGPIGVNLARTSEAAMLGENIAKGKGDTVDLTAEIERIKSIVQPYNKWVMMAIAAFIAACFTQISKGDWGAFVIALLAAGTGQFLRSYLQSKKLNVAPITFICGILSACIAAAGIKLGYSETAPSLLISSVIYMVPGLPLINGFIDMVSHKHLFIGLNRMVNAIFLFILLAVAIALASIFIT